MLKVITELEKLGLELTDEMKESIKNSIGEELYSKGEHEKKVKKAEDERDQYKERAENAEETLKGFDGKDFDTITKERDEWREKAEQAENDYKAKIAERDYKDAVEEAVKDLKFTSNSAKKAFMSDIMSDPLKMKDGKKVVTMPILQYIQNNWMEWLFAIITFVLGCLYRDVQNRLKDEQKRSTAIAEGVQSLLRESIVQNYNKYQEREYCPIYAKESIKRVYSSYHNLGGNDVATKLYNTLLEMPEEPKEKER